MTNDIHVYSGTFNLHLQKLSGNLFRLKVDGDPGKGGLDQGVDAFVATTKDLGIQVISTDSPKSAALNTFLERTGMQVASTKVVYSKAIDDPISEPFFNLVPAGTISFPEFRALFRKVSWGDPEISDDPDADLDQMMEMAGDQFNIDHWKMACLEEKCLGLVCPQLYPDKPKLGSLFYLGLLPKYRGQGLGKKLHRDGLNLLKQMGSKKYIGSTNLYNQSMVNIFEKNNCQEVVRQLFWGY